MSNSDVVYADVKFKNSKEPPGKFDATDSLSNDAACSEVRILKAQQKEPSTDSHADGDAAARELVGSKVRSGGCDPERVALGALCVLLVAAVIGLGVLYYDNIQTKETLGTMIANQKNFTGKTCLRCEDGWEIHRGTCYYFSNIQADWEKSRKYCQGKGGDLVKIETEEEQEFLERKLRYKMAFDEDKFWIGLTDSEEESKWFWVDDSPLDTRYTFWSDGEPDNHGSSPGDGEDCVRMGEKRGSNLNCWFDQHCSGAHKSICEKQATTQI